MTGSDPILTSLLTLTDPGQVTEVRIITQDGIGSGYFNNPSKMADAVKILDQNPQIKGIYLTLNTMNPALLARRENRIIMRLSKKDASTADQDIIRRIWLPIDIDPNRPSGVSSSEEEHTAALQKADEIAAYLSSIGWPEPIRADSGNGAHLLYRIDLPNDENSRDIVRNCLQNLHLRFSDSQCTVDKGNYNAARIWKLYGTMSRKGDNTKDRPHRRADLLTVPEKTIPVSGDHLVSLASIFPEKAPEISVDTKKGEQKIDLAAWLSGHGIGFQQKPYQDGILFLFDQCPFSDAHQDGAYAIQFRSGAIFAGCHHDSCGGGTQRWRELRRKLDWNNDTEKRLKNIRKSRIRARNNLVYEGKEEDTTPDEKIIRQAERILKEAHPIRYMLDVFGHDHEGDGVVAECLAMSLASRSVINSKGLHVSITGESGKGKSHAIDSMLKLVPPEVRMSGRMSDKALFYIQDLKPGTVIALDDITLSDQMQEILKGVTTSFQRPFLYRTVSKERVGMTCTIPERCVWWIAKVEGVGDDQIFNRMLTCWIDDSEEQDHRVLARMLTEATKLPEGSGEDREEVLVVRQMWRMLEPAWVLIPYAEYIQFQSAANRRNPDMLLDLIKTHAILMQYQREQSKQDDILCIAATKEDFKEAARLYDALHGETGGQSTKLTKREAALISSLQSLRLLEITIPEMQKITGWASSSLYKLLNGYNSRGTNYSGLLDKCPAISVYDRSVTTGEGGQTIQRRIKVYAWDPELYAAWVKGGAVTLLDEARGGSDHDLDSDDGPVDPDKPSDPNSGTIDEAVREKYLDSCRSEAGASHEKTEDITQNKECTHVHTDQILCEAVSTLTKGNESSHVDACSCVCDLDSAEHDEQNERIEPLIDESPQKTQRMSASQCRNAASLLVSQIHPSDFVRITGWPSQVRCAVCGKKHTVYKKRNRDQESGSDPVMLCEGCYNRAASHHVAHLVTLSGTIDLHSMQRVDRSLGRCPICNTFPITWLDPSSHSGMCDSCYTREMERMNKTETGSL